MVNKISLLPCLLMAGSVAAVAQTPAEPGNDFFENKVRPILAERCYACHTNGQMGGLRVDSKEAILKGGETGPAIVAGDPDHSLLIQAVRQTGTLKMPKGGHLKPQEIEDLVAKGVRGITGIVGRNVKFSRDPRPEEPTRPYWGITVVDGGGHGSTGSTGSTGGAHPAPRQAATTATITTPATAQPAAPEKEKLTAIYDRALDHVLAHIVPKLTKAGVPVTHKGVSAMTATLFIAVSDRQ